jgi:hypothetical protein
MNFLPQVRDAIAAAATRMLPPETAGHSSRIEIHRCEPFANDGAGGNDLLRVTVSWTVADESGAIPLILKHWKPGGLFSQLLGSGHPVELDLFESGLIAGVNETPGIYAPVLAAARDGEGAWTIMEDVTEDISRWKARTGTATESAGDELLLDRLARMHVAWEAPGNRKKFATRGHGLVSRIRRLQWLEDLDREWIGGIAPDPSESPQLRAAKESVAWARGPLQAFLDWLPQLDRTPWCRLMMDRAGLVAVSARLPETLLHGDVTPRNIGIRPGREDTIVLIDWELCGAGSHAFDIVHYLGNPPLRGATNRVELLEHYYGRYVGCGGRALSRETWELSLAAALVHYGIGLFPLYAGIAISRALAPEIAICEIMVERVRKAIAALGI